MTEPAVLLTGCMVCQSLHFLTSYCCLQEGKESGGTPGTDDLHGENAARNPDASSNGEQISLKKRAGLGAVRMVFCMGNEAIKKRTRRENKERSNN